jgi:hypothetical protein
MTRKVVKRSVIADHLDENAIEDYKIFDFDFPDENMLLIKEEEKKTNW